MLIDGPAGVAYILVNGVWYTVATVYLTTVATASDLAKIEELQNGV